MKYILIVLVVAIGAVLALASMQPNTYRYTMSRYIDAPPSKVFAELNSPKRAEKWSEWIAMDPDAQYSYAGPDSGVDASTSWEGKKSGAGSMTIKESTKNKLVRYQMDFVKPMAGVATVEYALAPEGNGTQVEFAMYGDQNFMGKVMNVFIDCSKMILENTEKSFAKMEAVLKEGR